MRFWRLTRWVGVLFAVVVLLPLAVMCVLYAPPVQDAVARWASAGLTQRMGRAVEVERIRLMFPLRVEVKGLHVEPWLHVDDIGADIRLRPLRRGMVVADYVSARGISIHADTLGDIAALRFRADGIAYDLHRNRAHIDRVFLDEGHASLQGGASPRPRDGSPGTLPLSVSVAELLLIHTGASYMDGRMAMSSWADRIALHEVAIDTSLEASLRSIEVADGALTLRLDGTAPWVLSEVSARADSLRYTPALLAGRLTHLAFKEAHGIDLREASLTMAWSNGRLSIPRFALHTAHSSLQGHLRLLDYNTLVGAIDGDADIRIGYADMRLLAERVEAMPEALTLLYPTETLSASIALRGTTRQLELTRCRVSLPTALDIDMSGTAQDMASPRLRRVQCHLEARSYDLDFLNTLVQDSTLRIPSGMTCRGDILYSRDTLHALCVLTTEEGTATVEAGYAPANRGYTLHLRTDSLDMQQLMPHGGLGMVSAQVFLEGSGVDYRHEATSSQADVQLRMVQWRGQSFTNIAAQAVLDDGLLSAHATCDDPLMQWRMTTTIRYTPDNIRAQLYAHVGHLDMLGLHLTDNDIRPTLRCHATLHIDSGEVYSLSARLTDITLATPTRHLEPRPLALQGMLSPDTALLAIHAGDLALMASAHTEGLPWQWAQGTNPMSNLAQLQATLTAGKDNPVSNYLALIGVGTDSIGLTARYADGALHAHLQSGLLTWRIPEMMLQGRASAALTWGGTFALDALSGVLSLTEVRCALPSYNLQLYTKEPLTIPFERGAVALAALPLYTTEGQPLRLSGTMALLGNTPTAHLRIATPGTNLLQPQATREAVLYGKAIVSCDIALEGRLNALSIAGDLRLRPGSSIHYLYRDAILTASNQLDNVVTFVSFGADTLASAPPKRRRAASSLNMNLNIAIDPTAQLEVMLGANLQNRVSLRGGGVLNLQYIPITGVRLAGQYSIEAGSMNMNVPLLHVSNMTIRQGSTVTWSGNVLNPMFDVAAEERVRASVTLDGSPQSVVFIAGVALTNTLEKLNIQFTLSAPENASMQNTLATLSPEERGKLSVALLTTGLYLGEGGTGNLMNTALMGILQSQIDNISRDAFRTVDVSVGIEPLPDGVSGVSTRTDYSFSIAKRLWDNRIRIIVGGSVTTNNERIEDNAIIDNISIEWRISPVGNQYLRFFYDKNFESILEGEIRETGVGYAYRRRF